ncbi:MAG TPA: hypothetical protein VGV35_05550 [Bryobacteraceae bacterium]|nr:hypothetical protein [Bryobacteraceae bacterium]
MRRIFTQRKRMLAAVAVAILGTLTFALVKPHVTRAFTLIELQLPAVQYGPVTVSQGQTVNVCAINWGDRTVQMVLGVVLASNTNMVLARMEQSVPAGMGACLPYMPAVSQNVAGIVATAPQNGNAPSTGNFTGNLNGNLGTSMQVTNTNNGLIIVVCEPQPLMRAQLPAALFTGGS